MDAINNLINRRSSGHLSEPIPSREELELIYKAALRAPDHGNLKPSRFIEVSGVSGLNKLAKIFEEFAKQNETEIDESVIDKYKKMPFRAPMVIILVSKIASHKKIPEIEQMMSTACAAQNILLALNALGYAGMWRTGKLSFNPSISRLLGLSETEQVIGYIYMGTNIGPEKKVDDLEINDFVTLWDKQ
tara:strand:- start:28715 stop:29281 length:567 start_codon:yes stop_codon:yes gene_type:complete